MKLIDLNLLLYAVNQDAPPHAQARRFWEESIQDGESVGLAWSVLLGFLRIATRPGIFPRPLPVDVALSKVDTWLALPSVVVPVPGDRHWPLLRGILEHAGAAGNLTTDASLAALAVEYDATLYSSDNDFSRFGPALRFKNPLIGHESQPKPRSIRVESDLL